MSAANGAGEIDLNPKRRSSAIILRLAATTMVIVPPLAALGPSSPSHGALDFTIERPSAPEPDRGTDVYADPESERVPFTSSRADVQTSGPDAHWIALFENFSRKAPSWRGDLVAERSQWALSLSREGSLIEPLLEALHDDDWRIQTYAAWALGVAGDSRAARPLRSLLQHPVWRVRAMAADALSRIGDETAATAMRTALEDPAWQVRLAAVQFFEHTAHASSERIFRAMQEDRHIAVRNAATDALARN